MEATSNSIFCCHNILILYVYKICFFNFLVHLRLLLHINLKLYLYTLQNLFFPLLFYFIFIIISFMFKSNSLLSNFFFPSLFLISKSSSFVILFQNQIFDLLSILLILIILSLSLSISSCTKWITKLILYFLFYFI